MIDSEDNLPCAATASGVPSMVFAVYALAFSLVGIVTSKFSVVTRLGVTLFSVERGSGAVRSSLSCTSCVLGVKVVPVGSWVDPALFSTSV